MPHDTKDRRLVGYIWDCGDPACECRQPIIVERWLQRACHFTAPNLPGEAPAEVFSWEEHEERVWEGSWMAEPASWDLEFMRDELCGACKRHKLERDTFEGDRWEREL